MSIFVKGAQRRIKVCATAISFCIAASAMTVIPDLGQAQLQVSYTMEPLVVLNDRGGILQNRLREIGQLRQQSRPVEIRGAVCFSTCTMFLGLPGTCVLPNTTFGFHGPSSYGRALEPALFERASEIIASHYPAPLQTWYMQTARYKINRIHRVKGEQIIKMGVRAC